MAALELRWPNWIGVVAEDLEAQRRFYRDILGLRELDAGDGWVQFDMGWPNMLEVLQRSDEPHYDRPRFQTGFAVDDIHAARQEMIARGATPLTDIDGGPDSGGYWCYFADPEGNVFEISQRVGESWS
ncbi:MAG: VOC family protein [Actinomycetota bacterium]|nr:VOC family protein [Actinomycetota bacterium]